MDDLNVRFILNCPEEELASLERVFFQIEQAHWFYDDFYRVTYKHLPHLGMKDFSQNFVKRCPSLKMALSLPDDAAVTSALNSFTKYKHKVPVCGVIMLNASMRQCVLVKGWIPGSAWGFPKGKMNADEPTIECAIREVIEETSFDATGYIMDPESDFIERKEKGQTLRLYIARNVPADFQFVTQTRKEISEIKWQNVEEMAKYNIGNGQSLSSSTKRFMGELTVWINQHQSIAAPHAQAKPSKRSRNKKSDSQPNSTPTSANPSPRLDGCTDAPQTQQPKDKRRGSYDVVTFGDDSKGWSVVDMFAVNETKFGVVDSFNMDEYTVPLPDAATQIKALEKYRTNLMAEGRGRSNTNVDKTSPNLQPHKQRKNNRRHSVGSRTESERDMNLKDDATLALSVANTFAMCASNTSDAIQQSALNTYTNNGDLSVRSPLVPSVAKIFASFAKDVRPPAGDAHTPSNQKHDEKSGAIITGQTCGTHVVPQFSFAFNAEEILSCI